MMVPYAAPKAMRLMGAMLNPTPENASFPPALLDWGSVIPGRCTAAWQRDKLEFQERVFDEVAVSVFWLWGANWMDALFSKLQKTIPAIRNIRTDIGDGVFNGDSLIKNGLTPLERYASHHKQALGMQAVRGSKTALSVMTNFMIIALLIPRLNQLKTEWLLKRHHKPQPPDLRLGASAPLAQSATRAQQAFGYLQANAAAPNTSIPMGAATEEAAAHPANVTFGGGGGALAASLKALEVIKSTDYGYILTGDGAMLAGRSYSAFTRPDVSHKDTLGEVREILWRDAVSSYLYLWGIPHLTRAFSQLLKPFWPSETRLEPMVGQMMIKQLAPWLAKQGQQPVTRQQLLDWWHGHAGPQQMAIKPLLQQKMQTVGNTAHFWQAVQRPASVPVAQWQQALGHIKGSSPHTLSAETFGPWLAQLHNQLTPLNHSQQWDVVRSLKHAFGQTVGAPLAHVLQQPWAQQALKQDPAMAQRMQSQAVAHTQQQLAWRFRHWLHQLPANTPLPQGITSATKGLQTLEQLADALDRDAIRPSIKGFTHHYQALPALLNALPQGQAFSAEAAKLLANPVLQQIENWAQTPWLPNALDHMVTGGLKHNPLFMQQAMALMGIAPENYKKELHPHKLRQLCLAMDAFWAHMVQALPKNSAPAHMLQGQLAALAKSRNLLPRYISLSVGVLGSLLALGVWVPKLQYWMTRKLTGHNEQPSIAALRQRYGLAQNSN
jgi:hypothetical protein